MEVLSDVFQDISGGGSIDMITTTRELLYQEIWLEAISKVAAKYGVSDNGLRKKCRKFSIPTPDNKYWGQYHAGHNPKPIPLPNFIGDSKIVFNNTYEQNNLPHKQQVSKKKELLELVPQQEKERILKIYKSLEVKTQLRNPHVLIQKHQEAIKKAKREKHYYQNLIDIHGFHIRGDEPVIDTHSVSEESMPRLYLFLDALFKAVEAIQGKVLVKDRNNTTILLHGCDIELNVKEKYNLTILPINEREDKNDNGRRFSPSGMLILILSTQNIRGSHYCRNTREWKETNKRKLSDMIQDVFSIICELPYYIELQKEEYRIEKEKEYENEKRRQQIRAKHDSEMAKTMKLLQNAELWYLSKRIEKFIIATEEAGHSLEGDNECVDWARRKAIWLDPFDDCSDPILSENDKTSLIETLKGTNRNSYN